MAANDQPPSPDAAPKVRVIGIGADGWTGLSLTLQQEVMAAEVVLGGARHLALLPRNTRQHRLSWPSPLRSGLSGLLAEHHGRRVVALASGDPLVSGIGSVMIDLLGADQVSIEPAVSSLALARARMGWSAESSVVVTLVGRDPSLLLRQLAPGRRVLVLSSDAETPALVAEMLTEVGYGASAMTVLGDLGSAAERRTQSTCASWSAGSGVSALNVIALSLVGEVRTGWTPGLPDEVFEHDGQLTKRDLRASALARLLPAPGQYLWDVGAGAGSIGIEWMRAHRLATATAIEAHPERAARIARNAASLGVPGLQVVTAEAPDGLASLPDPDAVFIGGGATVPGVLDTCLRRLKGGGRLVVHGVTVETEAVLIAAYREHGGELTRISVETATGLGSFTGWQPARTVTQWALRV